MAQGEDLTAFALPGHVRHWMGKEFDSLMRGRSSPLTQYGTLDTLAKVEEMKDRICALANQGKWFPPLA
jgi:hypothetical protein